MVDVDDGVAVGILVDAGSEEGAFVVETVEGFEIGTVVGIAEGAALEEYTQPTPFCQSCCTRNFFPPIK